HDAAVEVARPLTFAVLIIMTVYVPILTFQRIEGKLLRPMALTISLAVIGSLLLTLTCIPALSSLGFRCPPSERQSPRLRVLRGRPDGTDPEGPDNVELYAGLKPREEWATPDKDKLIEARRAALADMPGFTTNFSQPIKDNVDEALAGVKGELAIKLYGPDIFVMDATAREIVNVLKNVRGVTDLDWDHLAGLPPLQIVVDRAAAARPGTT